MNDKFILDVCCGSRMFYFDKSNENTIYMDVREILDITLCDGRTLGIKPDIIGDFRSIPFENNLFRLVIFDPPHLVELGTIHGWWLNTENYLVSGKMTCVLALKNVLGYWSQEACWYSNGTKSK